MIILDTNIISEMMKTAPCAQLMVWINNQEAFQLFITTITIAEICYGLNMLPKGKKRNNLEEAFHKAVLDAFKHRILPFDESAAHIYGKIMSQRKQSGRAISAPDGQIAAVARTNGAALATRNIRDFTDCELVLINPFND